MPPACLFWSRPGCHWPLVTPSWIGGPPVVQSAGVRVQHGDSGDLLLRGPRRVEPRVLQTRHRRSRGGLWLCLRRRLPGCSWQLCLQ